MTAIAAASVGVNTPDQIPPTMSTGMTSAGPASLNANHISRFVDRTLPLSQPVVLPYQTQTNDRKIAAMTAGTTPAIESCRIEAPDMNAYTKNGIESGISKASVPATASSAAMNGRL